MNTWSIVTNRPMYAHVSWQILRKFADPWMTWWLFDCCLNGAGCHMRFLYWIHIYRWGLECVTLPNCLELVIAIFRLSRWWASAILDLWGANLDHPWRVLEGFIAVQHLVGNWNRCSNFRNTKISIFCTVLGVLITLINSNINKTPKRHWWLRKGFVWAKR